jgi:hypothetical protein
MAPARRAAYVWWGIKLDTSKYRPPPSNSLTGFPPGLALRIAVSVNVMGATSQYAAHLPLILPPYAPGCQKKLLHFAGLGTYENTISSHIFWMSLELLERANGSGGGTRTPDTRIMIPLL